MKKSLLNWYTANTRPLPWRDDRNAYRIWISEVMLQQTTVQAVIPYYQRFLKTFPDLTSLAQAPLKKVLKHWAGLGYYSRARNLHKAAKALMQRSQFPRTYTELLELPGFGPYTARAVSSLAFGESVGVLDGNVIRVLTRFHGLDIPWWQGSERQSLQTIANDWVQNTPSHLMNQALMELGATVCTPHSPACAACPLAAQCRSYAEGKVLLRPLPKPRRTKEIWIWRPRVLAVNGRIAFIKNDYCPFLKGQWILPGTVKRVIKSPTKYTFKHAITHHEIFVQVEQPKSQPPTEANTKQRWIPKTKISNEVPFSLITKALQNVLSLALVIGLCTLSGCHSSPKTVSPQAPKVPAGVTIPATTTLALQGESFYGRFSPDGKKIVYSSRQRNTHSQAQVYEYDLLSKEEKRLTFQFGDTAWPAYHPSGQQIVFASSNDELKEDPWLTQNAALRFGQAQQMMPHALSWDWFSPQLPMEIYTLDLKSYSTSRLTKNYGLDADVGISRNGRNLIISSQRNKQGQLWLINWNGDVLRQITHSAHTHRHPAWHPNGQDLAWAQMSDDQLTSQIILGKGNETRSHALNLPPGLHLYTAFHPSGDWLLMSSNLHGDEQFELYAVRIKDSCFTRLTYSLESELASAFAPDGQTLVYSQKASNGTQLKLMPWSEPPACITNAAQVPSIESTMGAKSK